jgi:putative CocE/NonD family hydrolase
MVKNHQAHPDSVWMVSGPWEHGYPQEQDEPFGVGAYLAWWDHWLGEDDEAPLPAAMITSYELPGGDEGAGWTQFDEWPPRDSEEMTYRFDDESGLATEAGEDGARGFTVNTSDDPADDEQQIAAQTGPLEDDLVIAGSIRADLSVTFSADDGAVSVIVEDVDEDGEATRVTEGWLKASHRDGHRELADVEPGTEYDLSVDVWPTHYRFAAGHSLRVRIASDDYPEIESTAPAGDVTLRTGDNGSALHLPVLEN